MVWTSRASGVPLALLPLLIVLCAVPADSSSCPKCSAEALLKTKQMAIHIKQPTQALFKSYLTRARLLKPLYCKTQVLWFPRRNISRQPESTMLQELYRTLVHMKDSLSVIREQQKAWDHPDSPLHQKLEAAWLSASGLLINTGCALCLQELPPSSVPPLVRPTEPSTFDQKLKGCQVLWNYSKLIAGLAKVFEKQLNQGGRSAREGKRSRRHRDMVLLSD